LNCSEIEMSRCELANRQRPTPIRQILQKLNTFEKDEKRHILKDLRFFFKQCEPQTHEGSSRVNLSYFYHYNYYCAIQKYRVFHKEETIYSRFETAFLLFHFIDKFLMKEEQSLRH